MGKSDINKKENTNDRKKMIKQFILKNYKEILLVVMAIALTFLLIKIFTPPPKNDLLNYKLDQLDIKIKDLKDKQKQLGDSISFYKREIQLIDENIKNIRIERKTVNNYYEIKDKEIPGYTPAQIDSALRKRYNY
jgi:peptidoglycan hydrolase CwlO-like protein